MTATELPTSPVVDANRNLRPEWHRVMADIETAADLRKTYEQLSKVNVTELSAVLDAVEAALDVALSDLVPNNLLVSSIPEAEAAPWTTGVPHGLGTPLYLPLVRFRSNSTLLINAGVIGTGAGTNHMTVKTSDLWNLTEPLGAAVTERTFVTVSAISSEGIPQ